MGDKFVLRAIIITLIFLGQLLPDCQMSLAAGEPSQPGERVAPASMNGDSKSGEAELLTLNHLRDTGLSLQQIKQQAINIYLEVTRKDFQPTDNGELVYPKSISNKGLVKTHYLPPRMEWLFFYVGTMEPIIRLFADNVNDTKAGATRLVIPKAALQPLTPVWKNWSNGIENLNEQVTEIYKLTNEEKPDNIAIGRHAVAMYKIAAKLEKTRQKAVAVIRRTDKSGAESETVGIQ